MRNPKTSGKGSIIHGKLKNNGIKYSRISMQILNFGQRSIKQYCSIDSDGEKILQRAIDSFGFSARAYHRILKVSRTIADLEGEENILARHLSEAVQYRTLDRNLWIK